jgi:hypothetical protein
VFQNIKKRREAKKHPTGIEPVTSGSAIPHSTTELWMPKTFFMDDCSFEIIILEVIKLGGVVLMKPG